MRNLAKEMQSYEKDFVNEYKKVKGNSWIYT